jgi:hypothetical protein
MIYPPQFLSLVLVQKKVPEVPIVPESPRIDTLAWGDVPAHVPVKSRPSGAVLIPGAD